jgi:serine/threonine protein kinase
MKLFARKLLLIPEVSRHVIDKEARAIIKICGPQSHENIVEALRIGELRHTRYYFIDMELCDLTLTQYIYGPSISAPEAVPYFIKDAPSMLKAQQIWNVMINIANGLKYLHSLNMAHRDLKPDNGSLAGFNR